MRTSVDEEETRVWRVRRGSEGGWGRLERVRSMSGRSGSVMSSGKGAAKGVKRVDVSEARCRLWWLRWVERAA